MRAKKLIEKLDDLATFLTLSQNDAGKREKEEEKKENRGLTSYWAGRESAFNVAFLKVDGLIKEAKG